MIMKLLLKQRMWSWFDSFDIYDETGHTYFTVEGQLAWGHMFRIYDKNGIVVASLKEAVWTWMSRFYAYDKDGNQIGDIHKQLTMWTPKFDMRMNGKTFSIEGNWIQWDYQLFCEGKTVAVIRKEIWNWTDTYSITVNEKDALSSILIVLAIDAIKCNQESTST